jgi:hypothetical protein
MDRLTPLTVFQHVANQGHPSCFLFSRSHPCPLARLARLDPLLQVTNQAPCLCVTFPRIPLHKIHWHQIKHRQVPNQPLIVSWLILSVVILSSFRRGLLVPHQHRITPHPFITNTYNRLRLSVITHSHYCTAATADTNASTLCHIYSRLWESLHSLIHRLWPTVLRLTLLVSRLSCAVLLSTYRPPCPAHQQERIFLDSRFGFPSLYQFGIYPRVLI